MPEREVLRLDHIGEALVAALLNAASDQALQAMPLFDPGSRAIGRLGDLTAVRPAAIADVAIVSSDARVAFDGMHMIDVGLFHGDRAHALELKLGETALAPTTFRRRFTKLPTFSKHKTARVSGSMVAILDHNGRPVRDGGAPLQLTARVSDGRSVPVEQEWSLVLRGDTYRTWVDTPDLLTSTGTRQLRGIVSLDAVVEAAGGAERAREIARDLVTRSIERWFTGCQQGRDGEAPRKSAQTVHARIWRVKESER